jgi:uncharacterized protein (TIGR02996 family)
MTDAAWLLATVLDRPGDQAPWLVLSDWLEERGDPDSLARAELLRLRTAWATPATRRGGRQPMSGRRLC